MDRQTVTFTINLSREEVVPEQETVRAQVEFSITDRWGQERSYGGGRVNLPFAGWFNFSHSYDPQSYGQRLTEALFAKEKAHIAFAGYEREKQLAEDIGHVIVHLPHDSALLNAIDWELLRHPRYIKQPMVAAPDVLLRTHFSRRRENGLEDLPVVRQVILGINTSSSTQPLDNPVSVQGVRLEGNNLGVG